MLVVVYVGGSGDGKNKEKGKWIRLNFDEQLPKLFPPQCLLPLGAVAPYVS